MLHWQRLTPTLWIASDGWAWYMHDCESGDYWLVPGTDAEEPANEREIRRVAQ